MNTPTESLEEVKQEIAVLELEIGLLKVARKSPNPLHSIAAGRVEIRREEELKGLRERAHELEMAA